MRRFVVCIAAAAALVLGVFSAAPAIANHTSASGVVDVLHGADVVASYPTSQTNCSENDTCKVAVALSRRDFRRFHRWSPFDLFFFEVPANTMSASQSFAGPSTWSIRGTVTLNATHPDSTAVQIEVFRP